MFKSFILATSAVIFTTGFSAQLEKIEPATAAIAPAKLKLKSQFLPQQPKPAPNMKSNSTQLVSACGSYVILGCYKKRSSARRQMSRLGGSRAGGGAGLRVVNTYDYPNFRNGYHCVADGPYPSKSRARSVAWSEAVPDAYVKSGC